MEFMTQEKKNDLISGDTKNNMANSKPKVLGKKITSYQNPGTDKKTGFYKARTYGEIKKYQPKPYVYTKPREYTPKVFEPKKYEEKNLKPYEPRKYEYYYEYNPDYVEPKTKPKQERRTTTPKPTTPVEKSPLFPVGLNPLQSIKRQLHLYKGRRVSPQEIEMEVREQRNENEF